MQSRRAPGRHSDQTEAKANVLTCKKPLRIGQLSEAGSKIPYFLHGEDGILAMAGLYELWPDPELPEDDPNKWVWTCTVLTRPATDAMGHIHDRSPLILPESFWEHWLDPNLTDKGEVQAMINSVPEPHLEPYEVSTAVNSPRNSDPSLLEPVARP